MLFLFKTTGWQSGHSINSKVQGLNRGTDCHFLIKKSTYIIRLISILPQEKFVFWARNLGSAQQIHICDIHLKHNELDAFFMKIITSDGKHYA